jgi:hypothetical protein
VAVDEPAGFFKWIVHSDRLTRYDFEVPRTPGLAEKPDAHE